MDSGKKYVDKPPNPRATANPLSALTFSWILKTFWLGYKRDLEEEDLFEPLKEHRSDHLGDKVGRYWKKELDRVEGTKEEPSLLWVIIKCFGPKIGSYGIFLALVEIILRVAQPLFLGQLIQFFTPGHNENLTKEHAYMYAGGIVFCSAVNVFFIHPYMMAIFHIGMKMRVACCSLIYRKALKLSKTALGQTTIGQVVNLLSNDVNRFDMSVIFLHYLWIGPLETAIVTYFMWREVGWAAIIGVSVMLSFIPLQGFLGRKTSTFRLRTALRTDERVRLMNEIISGIQVIKMYAWENPFSHLVEVARKREIQSVRMTSYIRGIILSFIMFTTRISIFASVLWYVLSGQQITAEKVFVLTSYFNILRQTMTVFFPQGITQVAEALVSIGRLQKFLLYEETSMRLSLVDCDLSVRNTSSEDVLAKIDVKISEMDEPSELDALTSLVDKKPSKMSLSPGAKLGITMVNCNANWSADSSEDTLTDISLEVRPGRLVAIIGPTGAGKTSLLHMVLRELPLNSGLLCVKGSMSYASQEPWMFAGSVRQNILFGKPMERERYNKVVTVCALKRDFQLLPYGDKTMVGEKGISLSGGQRARINLARAVYMDADIYLLDDPLSAVDTHVGKHLFEDCISTFLREKTCILVTHQLQYLKHVDQIVILRNGRIEAEGTYHGLHELGLDFSKLLEEESEEDLVDDSKSISGRKTSIGSVSSVEDNQGEPVEEAETRTKGRVNSNVYKSYFAAGGNCCLISFMFFMCFFAQFLASASDYWITFWVNIEEERSYPGVVQQRVNESSQDEIQDSPQTADGLFSRDICIYVYTAVTLACIVVTLGRSFLFFSVCMRASVNLHNKMFYSITRATMWFFNMNSSGRILNRFSKDIGSIDELLPLAMIDTIQIGMALIGVIMVVAMVNYWLLLPTVLVGLVFYGLRFVYLSTSRSVKRLEGITRSPVFSHLNASLNGLTTIRAFKAQAVLEKEFDNHQDLHSSAWYIFIGSSRAFGFWLDVVCLIYITIVTMSFLVLGGDDFGGNVGLAITQAISLTGMFQWGMRQSAEMENQMTSVERVLEYTSIQSEPPLESSPDKKPPPGWPQEGDIVFANMYMRYSNTEPAVLKNLNFHINPTEKVGIVGRTGAGKSSLISSLFRLALMEGEVRIDGIDISHIGLHDLRCRISIIPQEPMLFSGTMRKNLDPFDEYSDHVLWKALEEVEMNTVVSDLVGGLSANVSEGGSNLSVGQRQLVCLARAIVKKNKVLVLDEATANVDPQTDALIQATIRTKFAECTVLTIAHRLNTVMDSERLLVVDAGTIVEFDHPHILLQNPNGCLYKMVEQTGKTMEHALHKMAESNFKNMKKEP